MASLISDSENQQLLRTVEMFEAITESQPEDYQSLEILKEAYSKLNRREEFLRTSKKLAAVYVTIGQISQSILEYEGILQEYPQDADARTALRDLEAKTSTLISVDESEAPPLVKDSKPKPPAPASGAGAGVPPSAELRDKPNEGDLALANILIAEKIVAPQAMQPLLKRLQTERVGNAEKCLPMSLVQMLIEEQTVPQEDLLTLLHYKGGLPFLPLAFYDVDRDVALMLPRNVVCQFCLVPFDRISHSVLVATTNPFDSAAREMVAAMLNQHVFWYLSPPSDIIGAIRRVHGLDNKSSSAQRPATKS